MAFGSQLALSQNVNQERRLPPWRRNRTPTSTTSGRRAPTDAESRGTAVPRQGEGGETKDAIADTPDAAADALEGAIAARNSAQRVRRRGAALTLLTQPPGGRGRNPEASLQPRTLLGY